MKRVMYMALSFLIFLSVTGMVFSQASMVYPVNIEYFFDNNSGLVVVTYDLLNSSELERYEIRLTFVDGKNIVVNPVSISGDTGENVTGGNNKKIV